MKENLTLEQQACNYETVKHIRLVQHFLNKVARGLMIRGEVHDESKLHSPEVELFTENTSRLAGLTYNSPEYNQALKDLGPALDHHYANNSHHPQFHKNGIDDMNLLDIIELFVDWKAASTRHSNGNIRKSIEINRDKFNMSTQLCRIFENTIEFLES